MMIKWSSLNESFSWIFFIYDVSYLLLLVYLLQNKNNYTVNILKEGKFHNYPKVSTRQYFKY